MTNNMSEYIISLKFHLRQKLGSARRTICPVKLPHGDAKKLHLGCGVIDHAGFINIDGIDRPHIHVVQNIVNLARFPDRTINFIYTSHTLEHFPRDTVLSVLKEWHRTLVKGGVFAPPYPTLTVLLRYTN
jgi:predicted SAM-dependent methyltransferase